MTLRSGLFVRDNTTDGVTDAQSARLALAGLLSGPGILSGFTVTGSSSGPNMVYTIAAGHVATARGTIAADGLYLFDNDGPVDKDSLAPAPSSGTRFDLIWVRHKNAFSSDGFGDADSTPEFGVEVGAASSTPDVQVVYASLAAVHPDALVLAESNVPTNAPNAASAVITMVADQVTTIPAAPSPVVGHISSSGGTASNGDTTIPLGASWDTTVQLTGGFTRVNGLVIPGPGTYLLTGSIQWSGNTAGRRGTWFTRNGALLGDTAFTPDAGAISAITAHAPTMPFVLSAGDVISLIPYQASGGSLNWNHAHLSATLIR